MKSGILIIDKPVDWTSHDVVAKLRRILKTKKIGHTGTLDPFATGVLVMLVGKATRLAKYLDKDTKSYEALVRFGFETDTGDKTGKAKGKRQKTKLKKEDIEKILPEFIGEISQVPPMYSAKKIKGKKLYELARKGIEIEREPVEVTISELRITGELESGEERRAENGERRAENGKEEEKDSGLKTQDFVLRVTCSAGTYIRTLAEDIGRKIGVPCHLAELRRLRAGKFSIEKAVTLEQLEEFVENNNKPGEMLVSMNEAVSHLAKVDLDQKELEQVKNGMRLRFEGEGFEDEQSFRLVSDTEELVAIGSYKSAEKFIQPRIVMI